MASFLTQHAQLRSCDVGHVQRHITQVFCPHKLILLDQGASLDTHLFLRQGQDMAYGRLRYGAQVRIEPQPLDDFYLLQIPLRGQEQIHTPNACFSSTATLASVISPAQQFCMEHSHDADKLFVRIDRHGLERHFRDYFGQDPGALLQFHPRIDWGQPAGASLRRLLNWQFAEISENGSLFEHPRHIQHFEQTLAYALLALQAHNQASNRPATVLPHVIRRALEFMEQHLPHCIGIADVAQAAGISVRSLHVGFRNHLHTSPMAHLKNMRLEAARRQLCSDRASVTQVALACGFTHLGQFAADYRKRYGERPSETLANARRDRLFTINHPKDN